MSARARLLDLLVAPPATASDDPWVDAVGGRPGSRGRLQDVWESGPGSLWYQGSLAVGSRLDAVVPAVRGTRSLHAFFRVEERLRLGGGETVLDVACGPGTLTARLARAVGDGAGGDPGGGLVVGCDLSTSMLARASRALGHPAVALLRADAMHLPLRDATVDAVCCSLALHLVPDPEVALAGIARVLRPGGRLAVAVPAHGTGPLGAVTASLERLAQARLFAPGELATALSRHGFEEVQEIPAGALRLADARRAGGPRC